MTAKLGAIDIDNTETSSLVSQIRDAYESRETDGILELVSASEESPSLLQTYSPDEIVSTCIEASNKNKGKAAGMINAWIGACYDLENGAELALQLLQAYDDISDEVNVYPDLVTFSLVYSIACQQEQYQYKAQAVLERAVQLSKKLGGSKRRRELAAERRRPGPAVSCKGVEQALQEEYGTDLRILQETNDFVVLSKPSGMVCVHNKKTTAGKVSKGKKKTNKKQSDFSLVDALLHHRITLSTLNAQGRGLVHRLDRGTSGCIVLAKTNEAHAKLVTHFFSRRAKKSYTAIVSLLKGTIEENGEIDMPVDGRPAKSLYCVLERFENGNAKLNIETFTGRKHQVRVHCAKGLDSPILLDPMYGEASEDGDGQFLLHATSLVIPEFGVDVQAPIPDWWQEVLGS